MAKIEQKTIAVIGCGTVGRNWALLFLRAGWQVRVFDPDPTAEDKMRRLFSQAQAEIQQFHNLEQSVLSFHKSLSEAVRDVDWIQESAPDRIDLKRKIYQSVQAHSSPNTLIASSSETLTAADIQACATRAKYMLVVRPLCEGFSGDQVAILEGPQSSHALLIQVSDFLKSLGLEPQIQLD